MRKVMLLIVCFNFLTAQENYLIKGKVTSSQQKPLEYVEVSLLNKIDSSYLSNTLTDTQGIYSLKATQGEYIIEYDFFGSIFYKNITIENQDILVETIVFKEENTIGEVTVEGQKKLIERKVDRLVFNVENSVAASGGNALDALKVTPSLRIEQDGLSLIGKSGVKVLINGKLSKLEGADLISYLESFSSEEISKIEVITNPPAKYDAEGNSGLVNIVLKKNRKDYFGGSIFNSYTKNSYGIYNAGGALNYQKNKLSLSASINNTNGKSGPYENQIIDYTNYTLKNYTDREDYKDDVGVRSSAEYQLAEKILIGTNYSYTESKPDRLIDIKSEYINHTNNLDSLILSKNDNQIHRTIHDLNSYVEYKIDTLGKKISFDLGYLFQKNNSNGFLESQTLKANTTSSPENISTDLNANLELFTSSVDIDLPYKAVNISFGGKLSFSETTNDFKQFFYVNETPVLDYNSSNEFRYKENTQAIYTNLSKNWKKWSIQLGLRLENTQTDGFSSTLNQNNKYDYIKLFPSFYITYKTDNKHTFGFDYGKRIGRPAYQWLNPFRKYFNPNYYIEGNPFLQPSFTDNLSIYHDYKNLYSSIWFSKTIDNQRNLALVSNDSNLQIVKPYNFITNYTIGLQEYYAFDKLKFWNSYNTLMIFYSKEKYNSDFVTSHDLDQFSLVFFTQNKFHLSPTLSAEINYQFQTPNIQNAIKFKTRQKIDAGLSLLIFNKSIKSSLYITDIFKTFKTKGESIPVNGISPLFDNYYDVQNIKFSFKYNFGKKVNTNKRTQSNSEEKNRIK